MRPIRDIFRDHAVLDADGRHVNGSDKQSNHNYGDAYESLFINPGTRRENVQLVMEVGVADGSCLLAWEEVFPNAHIVGMDIHPIVKVGKRVEFHLGDQRVKEDCDRAANGGFLMFDMIVEDATHDLVNSLLTLLYLWPYVRKGGLYVIEEFANIGALHHNVLALFPQADIIDTTGPFGGWEPLVVLRKPK